MKIIVDNDEAPVKGIGSVRPSKYLYAYTTAAGRLCILSRLGRSYVQNEKYTKFHYGFVPITKTTEHPTYTADDAKGAIQRALNAGIKVLEFENQSELIKWKAKKAGFDY